ncbi:MAG: hypothetical protein D4R68_07860 [Ignavibacteriales bacterium]|nr:MAG: hypothetical protein D4R68_07860 [Ignavibacteriales bacterium]
MGHKRLWTLPKSKAWRLIIDELVPFSLGASEISAIAQNTLRNVQGKFSNLYNDPSVFSAFEFLLHVSFTFQKENDFDKIVFLNI